MKNDIEDYNYMEDDNEYYNYTYTDAYIPVAYIDDYVPGESINIKKSSILRVIENFLF